MIVHAVVDQLVALVLEEVLHLMEMVETEVVEPVVPVDQACSSLG